MGEYYNENSEIDSENDQEIEDETSTTQRAVVVTLGPTGIMTNKKAEIQTKSSVSGKYAGIMQRNVKAVDSKKVTRREEVVAIRSKHQS